MKSPVVPGQNGQAHCPFPHAGTRAVCSLERNFVLEILVEVLGRAIELARTTAATAIAATTAHAAAAATAALAAASAVQHGERAVIALQDDLSGIAVITILVLPFAGLQLAFDVNLGALLQVLLRDPHKAFLEDRNLVPFGALAALTGILVFPGFRGRDPQIADLTAILELPDFRISAEIADKDDLVH